MRWKSLEFLMLLKNSEASNLNKRQHKQQISYVIRIGQSGDCNKIKGNFIIYENK